MSIVSQTTTLICGFLLLFQECFTVSVTPPLWRPVARCIAASDCQRHPRPSSIRTAPKISLPPNLELPISSSDAYLHFVYAVFVFTLFGCFHIVSKSCPFIPSHSEFHFTPAPRCHRSITITRNMATPRETPRSINSDGSVVNFTAEEPVRSSSVGGVVKVSP